MQLCIYPILQGHSLLNAYWKALMQNLTFSFQQNGKKKLFSAAMRLIVAKWNCCRESRFLSKPLRI